MVRLAEEEPRNSSLPANHRFVELQYPSRRQVLELVSFSGNRELHLRGEPLKTAYYVCD